MASPPESIRILHVDDEPDYPDMAATFVEREADRFDIQTATGGVVRDHWRLVHARRNSAPVTPGMKLRDRGAACER
ncbi:MAG: hypothetical protein ABEJ57_05445 [Halobacteriaceae archaeon]